MPMSSDLWTPDGDVATHERTVSAVTPQDMKQFADFDALVRKIGGISVICNKCDHAFTGGNVEGGRVWSISCKCREIKAENRGRIIT